MNTKGYAAQSANTLTEPLIEVIRRSRMNHAGPNQPSPDGEGGPA